MRPAAPTRTESAWRPGPSQPQLRPGAVHVWRADLEHVDEQLQELLCEQERARAERLLGERHRLLWARSRGLLRTLLGRYLREDPRTLRIAVDASGKPALRASAECAGGGAQAAATGLPGPAGAVDLSFNLAHSGALALYAFCAGEPVGIDVESERPSFDEVAIAARMLGAREAARLREIADGATRQREFLRAWTRYEAELKCLGTGIGARAEGARERRLWVAQLEPGMGAAGAVACTRTPRELRCWSWPAHDAPAG